MRTFCSFRQISGGARPALSRRLIGGGRACLMMKTDLQFDNRYIVHGLVAGAALLDSNRSTALAFGDLWITTAAALPAVGEPLPKVDIDDRIERIDSSGLDGQIVTVLKQLLDAGQSDFGEDFADSVAILDAVSGCLLPRDRAALEFAVGETYRNFGSGESGGFARSVGADLAALEHVGADAIARLLRLSRENQRWLSAFTDQRATYGLAGSVGQVSLGAGDDIEVVRGLLTLPDVERMAALGSPRVARAMRAALLASKGQIERERLGDSLRRALVVPDPILADFGAAEARTQLISLADDLSACGDSGLAALVALAWLALAEIDPIDQEMQLQAAWLRRFALSADDPMGFPPAHTDDEALPPAAWDELERIGLLRTEDAAREMELSSRVYGEEMAAQIMRALRTPRLLAAASDSLDAAPGLWRAVVASFAADSDLTYFVELMRDGWLPAAVAREVILKRPDIRVEQFARGAETLADAIYPLVRDMPVAVELFAADARVRRGSRGGDDQDSRQRRRWRK